MADDVTKLCSPLSDNELIQDRNINYPAMPYGNEAGEFLGSGVCKKQNVS